MNSSDWLAYFRQNRLDRRGIAWHEGIHLHLPLRAALARSLARFQLGETSDGAALNARARRLAEETGDYAYANAVELFIAEKQEHSRLLAIVLEQLNAPLLRHHWTDSLFRRSRHLLGYYEEVSVLLMAEIIALKYYGAVREGCGAPVLEIVCEQILADEKFHIRFHCEKFHKTLAGRPMLIRAAWWSALTALFVAASAVVAWDHRRAFRALGGSASEFLRDAWFNFRAARAAIFGGVPFARGAAEQTPSGLSGDHRHAPPSPA